MICFPPKIETLKCVSFENECELPQDVQDLLANLLFDHAKFKLDIYGRLHIRFVKVSTVAQ